MIKLIVAFLNFAKAPKKVEKKSKGQRMQNMYVCCKNIIPQELTSQLISRASLILGTQNEKPEPLIFVRLI